MHFNLIVKNTQKRSLTIISCVKTNYLTYFKGLTLRIYRTTNKLIFFWHKTSKKTMQKQNHNRSLARILVEINSLQKTIKWRVFSKVKPTQNTQPHKDASVLLVPLINDKYDKTVNKYDINCFVTLTCKYYILVITNTLQNWFFLDLG